MAKYKGKAACAALPLPSTGLGLKLQPGTQLELALAVGEVGVVDGSHRLEGSAGVGDELVLIRAVGEFDSGGGVGAGADGGDVLVVGEIEGFAEELEAIALPIDDPLGDAEVENVDAGLLEEIAIRAGYAIGASGTVEGAGVGEGDRCAAGDGERAGAIDAKRVRQAALGLEVRCNLVVVEQVAEGVRGRETGGRRRCRGPGGWARSAPSCRSRGGGWWGRAARWRWRRSCC